MIAFSKSNEKPHGVISPLFMRSFEFEGVVAASAEHAFQYGKPKRAVVRDWMMAAPSPSLLTTLSAALPTWEINKGGQKVCTHAWQQSHGASLTSTPILPRYLTRRVTKNWFMRPSKCRGQICTGGL